MDRQVKMNRRAQPALPGSGGSRSPEVKALDGDRIGGHSQLHLLFLSAGKQNKSNQSSVE